MKEIIKFKAIGELTFSEKPTIIQTKQDKYNGILQIVGLISLLGGIFWSDMENWFKRRFL
jgi:hypothetical protein